MGEEDDMLARYGDWGDVVFETYRPPRRKPLRAEDEFDDLDQQPEGVDRQ